MPRPQLVLHNLHRPLVIKTRRRTQNIHKARPMKQQEINTLKTHLRWITQRHDLAGIIYGTRKILGNSRLGQRLSNSIMIPWNQNHLHILRNLSDKLRGQPILLVNIRHLQVQLLTRIPSNTSHKIPADDNILDAISNVPLVRTSDLALQPAQDPAESILHEHLTPNMNIRNQHGVDLVASAPRPMIRNLRQDNILCDQQLPGTLSRLQKQYLISRNPTRGLPD